MRLVDRDLLRDRLRDDRDDERPNDRNPPPELELPNELQEPRLELRDLPPLERRLLLQPPERRRPPNAGRTRDRKSVV